VNTSTFEGRARSKSTLATERYYAIFLNVPILAIAVALTIAMCGLSMFAQSGAGSIQGTVTDATGGIIPAAAVHVVNVDVPLT
jgi:hypothetical protein